jgi:NAD(P)H dehydrogenase (quinone)
VYYSSSGQTHALATAAADAANTVTGTSVDLVRIQDADIQNGRWKNEAQIAVLNAADAILFGTPTYMGGVSAQMKCFIDACGGIWYQQKWKDKLAAAFTHSQGLSGDKLNTLMGLFINAMQHGMIWVGTGTLVAGRGEEHTNRLSSYSGAMASSFPDTQTVTPGDTETVRLLAIRLATYAGKLASK